MVGQHRTEGRVKSFRERHIPDVRRSSVSAWPAKNFTQCRKQWQLDPFRRPLPTSPNSVRASMRPWHKYRWPKERLLSRSFVVAFLASSAGQLSWPTTRRSFSISMVADSESPPRWPTAPTARTLPRCSVLECCWLSIDSLPRTSSPRRSTIASLCGSHSSPKESTLAAS